MSKIRLPDKPRGPDYEDFVAACLSALGYFIESNMHLRDRTVELTELDTVASPTGDSACDRIIFEAKSASSGFQDIFKLYGLKHYLQASSACLATCEPIDPSKSVVLERLGQEIGVKRVTVSPDIGDMEELAPPCSDVADEERGALAGTAWFHHIAIRIAYAAFKKHVKSRQASPLATHAREYDAAREAAFFDRTALRRVNALYEAWRKCPRLTGEFVDELVATGTQTANDIYTRLENTGKRLWLQYVMLLEHRARIGIIKNALDHVVSGEPNVTRITVGTRVLELNFESLLPTHFRDALAILRKHPFANQVPYLLQIFVEYFGGFYHKDAPEDLQLLSVFSGIPVDQVEECLRFLDKFFPFKSGWFHSQRGVLIRLKLVPAIVLGTGCFLRSAICDCDDYEKKYPVMGWLMSKWHNALFEVLESRLKV